MTLFELFSSSISWSSRSSLLPLMLSPSPSSDSVKSWDSSVTSPSGVVTLSGRSSGSSVFVPVSPVSWVAGSPVSGSSCCSSVLFAAPLGLSGSLSYVLVVSPLGSPDGAVLRRSALAVFFAASSSQILACSLSLPLLCLCSAASLLASAACLCLIILRGPGSVGPWRTFRLCSWVVVL